MGRGKSFNETDFLRAIPEGEDNALTTQEIADKVGCSYSLTSKMLRELHNKGEVFMGRSGDFGRFTYYMPQKRPEISLPYFKDGDGVSRPITWWLREIQLNARKYPETRAKIIFPTVLQLSLSALGYNNAISIQEQWAIQKARTIRNKQVMKSVMEQIESIEYEPLLNDGKETLDEVAATFKGVFHDLEMTEEELLELARDWG